ncbi:MAG: DUF1648 domain-containing protein [Sphingobacteriia bacterium]|nr:DUF1648 domain-containing protein [Sphingobacteriia bacterium]
MKLKYTVPQIIFEVIGAILLIALFVFLGIKYGSLPDTIPTHFNSAGEIDGWGSKSSIWVLPILGVFLYLLATVVSFFPSAWNFPTSKMTPKNKVPLYQCMKTFLIVTKIEMISLFLYITLSIVRSVSISYMLMYAIIAVSAITGLMFFLIGRNIIRKYV